MFKKKFRLVALILCVFLTIGYFAVNTGAVSTVLLAIQGAITDGNLVKFSGTNGIGVDAGLSATNVVKCKFDATIAPTINNDVSEGYTVGSRWLDVTNDKSYVCLDNSDGAAVWIETTGEGGGATTFTGLTDTPANYIGSSLKHVRVNVGETALEFVTLAGGGDMLKATYDIDENGDIDVAAGGTEKSLWTLYCIPYLSGTTAFGEIPIGTAGQVLKVSTGATGYEFANESDPTVDEDSELKAILVDEVTKTGDFTAGRIAKINNATGIIEQGTNTDTDVADSVTKKHSQNTDTQFDFANALASDHTYSGQLDSQPVGENVVFGEILYKDWTTGEWMKAKADVFGTTPGTRIALETKANGETCLMLVKGYIRDDSAFDFGATRVFLNDDVAGTCDDTAPAEAGDQIQMVGEAKSADILFFNPSQDVGEI